MLDLSRPASTVNRQPSCQAVVVFTLTLVAFLGLGTAPSAQAQTTWVAQTQQQAGEEKRQETGNTPTTQNLPAPIRPEVRRDAALSLPSTLRGDARDEVETVSKGEERPKRELTVFQRLVKQTTGQDLPLFGYKLFDRPPQGFAPVRDVPLQAAYVLGPGDEVLIRAWGAVDFDIRAIIDRDGMVSIPKVGTFSLAGIKAEELQPYLLRQIGRVFKGFSLNATLGQLRTIQVFVVGQAQRPGSYTISSLSTLVNALFASGGPNFNGTMRNIQLKREGKSIAVIDLYDFILQGEKPTDVRLQPGDIIVIPPAGRRVALLGAVNQPGIYELSGKGTLQDLLAYAGKVDNLVRIDKLLVERINQVLPTAPHQALELRLDAAGLATTLWDGDMVTLLPVANAFANAVTLVGRVAMPLRYPHKPGMTLLDLLPDRDALLTRDYFTRMNVLVQYEQAVPSRDTKSLRAADAPTEQPAGSHSKPRAEANDQPSPDPRPLSARTAAMTQPLLNAINWDYASIERLNRATMATEFIPFNLGKVVLSRDPASDLVLLPGDVVRIFDKNDLSLPAAKRSAVVRLEGEVAAPGIYTLRPGESLRQLLDRTGGLTAQAYLFGVRFLREETRLRQEEQLTQILRRVESQVQVQSAVELAKAESMTLSNTHSDSTTKRALLGQTYIESLRNLRPEGRVSLDLRPALDLGLQELPDIRLEDGDQILVPSRHDFISLVGAIDNESALLWKPGRTVGDALAKAGHRPEADLPSAFVLRADGTILNRRSLSWWSSFENQTLLPGDALVVPFLLRPTGYSVFMNGLKDWTQVLFQLGVGAAAVKVLK